MSQYFPEIAWRTILTEVVPTGTDYYYYVNVSPVDPNEPGADPTTIDTDCWVIDYAGYSYQVTAINGSTLTIYDVNERKWGENLLGPSSNMEAYVYKPKNNAFLLTQAQLRYLDKSAPDKIYPVEKGVAWAHRGIEIDALYGDSELVETIAQDSIDNITKLTLSSEFILRLEEAGWQGGKKFTLSLDGLLHNNLQDIQGTGLDDDWIHLDQNEYDALWTLDGLNITRDSAASLTGILNVNEIKSYTDALPLIKKDGSNVRVSTCILSDCVNDRVGIFTETPLDHLHLTGYVRISTLAETSNSSIVTSNADGRLVKLPYDNNESKYLRSDGTWATVLISSGDFLDSVIRMVINNTFDPGTPTNGDRYIILNASSIHANFGTINKFSNGSALTLGNNDIVQYFSANSEFRIVYDASAALQPATVTVGTDKNGNTNHQWTYNVTDDIWVDRGATVSHNSLDGLNDGDYKHLTATQYTNFISLTDGSNISNTLHNHNTVYYTKTHINDFFSGATSITGYNKSNWDTAYSVRQQWSGVSTNLDAATGRASLDVAQKQSSTTDTTAGRGLIVGAFGLGGLGSGGNNADLNDTSYILNQRTSFSTYTSTSLNKPAGANFGTILNIQRNSNEHIQIISDLPNNELWFRTRYTTAPNVWKTMNKLYHTGNLVNPVTGTGIAGYLPKFTGTSSLGNSVIYETGGNVLIGTATDSGYKLDVSGHEIIRSANYGEQLTIRRNISGGGYSLINFETATIFQGRIGFSTQGDFVVRHGTNASNTISVTPTGLAIGKTSVTSGYLLDVNGAIQSTGLKVGTLSGLLKASSGVVSTATAGTDYVAPNAAITGATKTKVTYDSKGLVTSGADATTTDIAEGTRLYYTDSRARAAISLTTTGTSGAATYTAATGVLNIPQYQAVLTNPITGTGTANQIAYFTGTTSLASLSTATYPSLTELRYVKGVTSALQTQLNSKQATLVSGTNIKTVATNSILGSGSLINITISATEPSTSGKLNGDIWVES